MMAPFLKRQMGLSLLLLCLHVVGVHSVCSQDVITSDDFDVVVIPVAGSTAPEGTDFAGETLAEMGLSLTIVFDEDFVPFPVPADDRIRVSADRIEIELLRGEAIQLFSRPVPVSATPVLFTSDLTIRGAFPAQAAVAMIDSNETQTLGVYLAQQNDLVTDQPNEFSYSFEPVSGSIQLLLQFQGPQQDQVSSTLVLERLRLAQGIASHDLSVGNSRISEIQTFTPAPAGIQSTAGGYFELTQDTNRTPSPEGDDQAFVFGTTSRSDVVTTLVPVVARDVIEDVSFPATSVVAEVYLQRRSGSEGTVSLAIFSPSSGSTGVYELPVRRIPENGWLRVQSPLLLRRGSFENPQVLLQIRGGVAELVADDVVLRALHDSIHVWDSSLFPSLFPDE